MFIADQVLFEFEFDQSKYKFQPQDLSAGKISQVEFFESLEISRTQLETALACLAPEEEGSEAARCDSLDTWI